MVPEGLEILPVTEKCTKNDGYLSVTDVPLCYSLFPKNYIRFSGSMDLVVVGHLVVVLYPHVNECGTI